MSVSEAERLVRIVGSNAIGKHLYPHLLRHAKAVHLRQAGTSIENLRDFLGHKDVRTTLIYARIVPTELKKLPRTI
ncbi:MAG: tyrosine-type recombinase/integrase [archaeon]|nr:tyrosine-type recombinase/integrase [archaeon]